MRVFWGGTGKGEDVSVQCARLCAVALFGDIICAKGGYCVGN